mmetsp:Transcript_17602/g.28947  ORF Transcript_17602/g.28947 Transcript_17602/m.28947 type:complete len:203 (-) Transcript_17602:268-876(-)
MELLHNFNSLEVNESYKAFRLFRPQNISLQLPIFMETRASPSTRREKSLQPQARASAPASRAQRTDRQSLSLWSPSKPYEDTPPQITLIHSQSNSHQYLNHPGDWQAFLSHNQTGSNLRLSYTQRVILHVRIQHESGKPQLRNPKIIRIRPKPKQSHRGTRILPLLRGFRNPSNQSTPISHRPPSLLLRTRRTDHQRNLISS